MISDGEPRYFDNTWVVIVITIINGLRQILNDALSLRELTRILLSAVTRAVNAARTAIRSTGSWSPDRSSALKASPT